MIVSDFARRLLAGIAATALISTPAGAWHEQGHKDVGAIAARKIAGHHAADQVRAILGNITLEQAGPWGDCVRPVSGPPNFRYGGHPSADSVCRAFADGGTLQTEMEQYVRHNWTQCPHTNSRGCHTQYHFVDLAIQRSEYEAGLVGTHDYDLVFALNAAARILARPSCSRQNPSTAVQATSLFRFTCRQALMMLTHFVGDLHQPLHVGSVYLDGQGQIVDPDSSDAERRRERATMTAGGNSLRFINDCDHGTELHGFWDDTNPFQVNDAQINAVPLTQGARQGWAVLWVKEILPLAARALSPLTFSEKHDRCWTLSFPNPGHDADGGRGKYRDDIMRPIQRDQIVNAGARLGHMLMAIWPDPA